MIMEDFKFKEGAKAEIGGEDPWYCLTDGGYLKPEEVLADSCQAKKVQDAVDLVKAFIEACSEAKVIDLYS
jgi:hypothetical protein